MGFCCEPLVYKASGSYLSILKLMQEVMSVDAVELKFGYQRLSISIVKTMDFQKPLSFLTQLRKISDLQVNLFHALKHKFACMMIFKIQTYNITDRLTTAKTKRLLNINCAANTIGNTLRDQLHFFSKSTHNFHLIHQHYNNSALKSEYSSHMGCGFP